MQKEKNIVATTTAKPPKLVAALPNEILFKILCLIKKDHEAEVSQIIEDYCIEVFDLKNRIAALRNEVKHNALRAGLYPDRNLFTGHRRRPLRLANGRPIYRFGRVLPVPKPVYPLWYRTWLGGMVVMGVFVVCSILAAAGYAMLSLSMTPL